MNHSWDDLKRYVCVCVYDREGRCAGLGFAQGCVRGTLRKGLRRVSMMKSYLHSSQQRVPELWIHWCRQAWCTKRRLPVHLHGVMRGHSSSLSQWQILETQRTFTRA